MNFYEDIVDKISKFTCSFDETADLHTYIDAKEALAPDRGLAFYAELKLACKAYDRFSFQNMDKPYSFTMIYATGYCTTKIKELAGITAEPEKPEPRLMQVRLLHFYFSLGMDKITTAKEHIPYAKKLNLPKPKSFSSSYYQNCKGNELKFTPYFRISDFEAVVILLKDYKVLQEKAQQVLKTWENPL